MRTYHVFLDQLGRVAAEANVDTLVLTHQVPAQTPEQAAATFIPAMSASFGGEIVVAEDGTRVTLEL